MLSNIFWAMRSLCFDFFSLFFASVCASHNINGVSVRNDVHTTLWRRKTWHVAIWQHEREAASHGRRREFQLLVCGVDLQMQIIVRVRTRLQCPESLFFKKKYIDAYPAAHRL
jgi:hypothetical protein